MSTNSYKGNNGALFKNDRKEQANHPDYKGSITIDGVDYWLSAWIKPMPQDASKKYMSLSAQVKEQTKPEPPAYKKPSHDGFKARQTAPQEEPPF